MSEGRRSAVYIGAAALLSIVYFVAPTGDSAPAAQHAAHEEAEHSPHHAADAPPSPPAPTPMCPGDGSVVLLDSMCAAVRVRDDKSGRHGGDPTTWSPDGGEVGINASDAAPIRDRLFTSAQCEALLLWAQGVGLLQQSSPSAPRACVRTTDALAGSLLREGRWGDCVVHFNFLLSILSAFRSRLAAVGALQRIVVWDVGSHVGTCAMPLAASGFTVVAVEKSAEQRQRLLASRALSRLDESSVLVHADALEAMRSFKQQQPQSVAEGRGKLIAHVVKMDVEEFSGSMIKESIDQLCLQEPDVHRLLAMHVEINEHTDSDDLRRHLGRCLPRVRCVTGDLSHSELCRGRSGLHGNDHLFARSRFFS